MFFEGSEKKVEILIDQGGPSLRHDRSRWEKVVAKASAAILSSIKTDHFDAYLLSESSLFVYDNRIIMITCGGTTLADAIGAMFEFIDTNHISFLMYERKNEHRPSAQPSDFDEDVAYLSRFVPGEVHRFGEKDSNRVFLFHYNRPDFKPHKGDITLELLMHGLSDGISGVFNNKRSRQEIYDLTGIDQILPGYKADDFVFDPLGYSTNAVLGSSYYTFHVTPQRNCSYASFETNHVFGDEMDATINRVLDIFKPESLAIMLFDVNGRRINLPRHYQQDNRVAIQSCGFQVQFVDYTREMIVENI